MITAKIIADSISHMGKRITTFELEYPRFIHSEFMTHRQFSRNAASSRAIPVEKMVEYIDSYPAHPEHWGKNMPGMQAKEELEEPALSNVKSMWNEAKDFACKTALKMHKEGAHKQIVNRILEPFQTIKVVMTTTEIENFFYLRAHPDAQPEIKILAEKMKEVYNESKPKELFFDCWHLPYYKDGYWDYSMDDKLEDALAISASCCAQVSYRKLDNSIDKAREIYKRLVENKPVHASPFEHQATPMLLSSSTLFDGNLDFKKLQKGITHIDKDGYFWSGNFKGWIQYRQLISGHVYTGEEK